MPQHKSIFSNLERVADSVVALFGKNCEACIHDLTSLQKSLVYITGDVTGRKLGAPATDLLIRKLQQDGSNPRDIHNYKTTTNDGRSLKSSTTFIKDKNGQPIAAFCINFDTTEFYNASQALIPLLNLTGKEPPDNNETFSHSTTETIEEVFNQGVGEVGKHPATMSVDEKTQLITYLEENGVFQLKGSVEEVGHLMGVTKFTVYNYLKKVRNQIFT
jgi:predicted transcriptional regulator YheO